MISTFNYSNFHYIRIIESFLSDRKRFRSFALGNREEVDLFDIIYNLAVFCVSKG